MRFQASRTWAGAAAVLSIALAACANEGAAPEPEPEPEPEPVATTPVALTTTLRYCLSPELGEATPIVATLIAALPDVPGDGVVELVHVPEADADCRFDNPDIDLAVASWKADGGCTTTTEDLACMVRTLLVDLDDLGESTADVADTQVATDLRMQLDYMIELTPEAPAIVGPPPGDPLITGCGGVAITSITPAAPTSYQAAVLSATYVVDPINCGPPSFSWVSSLDGGIGTGASAVHQFSVGTHTITFAVSVTCTDPNDLTLPPVTFVCTDSTTLDVVQGVLATGDYCDRSADWWMAEEAAGNVHIQDESATTMLTLIGTDGQDLLIGNDRPNKINGKRIGDCLMGNGERDDITGHAGADTIFGHDGNDRIVGHDDKDVIRGGRGNDNIRGGSGGDLIYGEDGDDNIDGNFDSDTIYGGNGADRILGGMHDDVLSGGDGNDCLHGDNGNDQLFGDSGADNLNGELGRDDLNGGDGDDAIDGGWNDDLVRGNGGNDALHGGNGDDNLFGGDGDDGLCGDWGFNDTKDGGNHVNGDACHGGGANCEIFWGTCQLPSHPSC